MIGTGLSPSVRKAEVSFKKTVDLCVPASACVVPSSHSLPFLRACSSVQWTFPETEPAGYV